MVNSKVYGNDAFLGKIFKEISTNFLISALYILIITKIKFY